MAVTGSTGVELCGEMLLPTKTMKRRYSLVGQIMGIIYTAALLTSNLLLSASASVVLDPLLAGYLDEGCALQIALKGAGKPVLHGPFSVVTNAGAVVVRGTFKNGVLHGDVQALSADGTLISLARYSDGKTVGQRVEWGPDGSVTLVSSYDSDGNRDGMERYYTNGRVTMEWTWLKGKPVEVRIFDAQGKPAKELRDRALHDWIREEAMRRAEATSRP